jgi:hypothetical protein
MAIATVDSSPELILASTDDQLRFVTPAHNDCQPPVRTTMYGMVGAIGSDDGKGWPGEFIGAVTVPMRRHAVDRSGAAASR